MTPSRSVVEKSIDVHSSWSKLIDCRIATISHYVGGVILSQSLLPKLIYSLQQASRSVGVVAMDEKINEAKMIVKMACFFLWILHGLLLVRRDDDVDDNMRAQVFLARLVSISLISLTTLSLNPKRELI